MKFAEAMHKIMAKTFFLSYNNFDMQWRNEKCIFKIYLYRTSRLPFETQLSISDPVGSSISTSRCKGREREKKEIYFYKILKFDALFFFFGKTLLKA